MTTISQSQQGKRGTGNTRRPWIASLRVSLFFLLLAIAPAVIGCPCEMASLCTQFTQSDVVFVGTVLPADPGPEYSSALLRYRPPPYFVRVDEVWKGPAALQVGSSIDVSHVGHAGDGGTGKKVLVFAQLVDGIPQTPYCSGLYRLDDVKDFATQVSAWLSGQGSPWVEGYLFFGSQLIPADSKRLRSFEQLPFEAGLVLESGAHRYTTPVTEEKRIDLENLVRGVYATSVVSDTLTLAESPTVDLLNNPCFCFSEQLRYRSAINGRLVNAAGEAVAGALIEAEQLLANGTPRGRYQAESLENGTFSLAGLEPGNYRIRFQSDGPSAAVPYGESYFPTGATEQQSFRFLIQGTEQIDLGVVSLGPAVSRRKVRLTASLPDGSPAHGAVSIFLELDESGQERRWERNVLKLRSEDGNFEAQLLEGPSYAVVLRLANGDRDPESSAGIAYENIVTLAPGINRLNVQLEERD